MGLLSEGTPLSWEAAQPYLDHVRAHGIEQFIYLYEHTHRKQKDCLKWGEEVTAPFAIDMSASGSEI